MWTFINNQWVKNTQNTINTNIIRENQKDSSLVNIETTAINKSIVYVPVHNINDIYEWYRLFNDSYLYSSNYDEIPNYIHGWLNNRGTSIKNWYNNLYTVKCTSTENINISNTISIIDSIELNNGDLVLLKDQTNKYENGIYKYENGVLIEHDDMFNYNKSFNQIIYTYLGELNKDKQFYLRRIEDINDINFTKFPVKSTTSNINFTYSEGDVYLLKCEFDYSLNISNSTINTNVGDCCECISDSNLPTHPTIQPYSLDDNPFRMLILDNSYAEKIYTNINNSYTINNNIPLSFNNETISFLFTDINNDTNVLNEVYIHDFYDTINLQQISYKHKDLINDEAYTCYFDIIDNNNFTSNSELQIIDNNLKLKYSGVNYFPTQSLVNNDFINLKIKQIKKIYTDSILTTEETIILDNTFFIKNKNIASSGFDIDLDIFPYFDQNIISELEYLININGLTGTVVNGIENSLHIELNDICNFGVKLVSTSGFSGNDINIVNLQNKYNTFNDFYYRFNMFVGKYYNFKYDGAQLIFTNIKPNTIYKYNNYGIKINVNLTEYYIESEINKNYKVYSKDYTIDNYLTNYLTVNPTYKIIDFNETLIYSNLETNTSRIGIEKNQLILGYINENIYNSLKTNTFNQFINTTLSTTYNVFIINKYEQLNSLDNKEYVVEFLNLTTNDTLFNSGNNIQIKNFSDINAISDALKYIFNSNTTDFKYPKRIDTAQYAYDFMKPGELNDLSLINNITGIVYNENNNSRVTLLKRDKDLSTKFKTTIIDKTKLKAASINNINIGSTITDIDGYTLQNNDIVLLKDQTIKLENGLYICVETSTGSGQFELFNTINYSNGNTLIYLSSNDFYLIENGNININKIYKLLNKLEKYTFIETSYNKNYDDRLHFSPISIAKLGVDNNAIHWQDVSMSYDSIESEINKIQIQPGINSFSNIRFIDGLTQYNILNNINGQGIYKWILKSNVIVQNAVVGCTQDSGPGTGTLIWYSGTWLEGTWCNGIWYSGIFKSGTWVNGTWYSNPITDNYYTVSVAKNTDGSIVKNQALSLWEKGSWLNGTFNAGKIININWYNGTFNDGTFMSGNWYDGTFNGGTINTCNWYNGIFNDGIFEQGNWYKGIFSGGSIGTKSTTTNRTFWYDGTFNGGTFNSGLNTDHKLSIFYTGSFNGGSFNGGSFVCGIFKNAEFNNGVWIGGYKISISEGNIPYNNEKKITIDLTQYNTLFGITEGPTSHNLYNTFYGTDKGIYINATALPVSTFSELTYLNQYLSLNNNLNNSLITKHIVKVASNTDTTINIFTSNNPIDTSFVTENINNGILSGQPILLSQFLNSTFNNGIWLNGYCGENSEFKNGLWVNGIFEESILGE